MSPVPCDPLTAVGKSIDVEVRPDPTSCSLSASQLAALAEACERSRTMLECHARVGEEQFGGLSGIVYRHSSTLLRQATERTGRRARQLAEGLAAYARGITEVQRLMDEAVAVASPYLTVGGGRIWSPVEPTSPDDTRLAPAWGAWRDAVDRWRAARALEDATSQAWLRVVGSGVVIDEGGPPVLDLPLEGTVR